MAIGLRTSVGARPHRVRVQNPGEPVSDGDGGYTQEYTDLDPAYIFVEIKTASATAIEELAAGSTLATATHVLTGPYHPGITTKTVLTFEGRSFAVGQVVNVEERSQEMTMICTEIKP